MIYYQQSELFMYREALPYFGTLLLMAYFGYGVGLVIKKRSIQHHFHHGKFKRFCFFFLGSFAILILFLQSIMIAIAYQCSYWRSLVVSISIGLIYYLLLSFCIRIYIRLKSPSERPGKSS